MSAVEPTYEQRLTEDLARSFVDFFLADNPLGRTVNDRAKVYAEVAMKMLRGEVDNAVAWGVSCTGCADYLDRLYGEFVRGERAGVVRYSARLTVALLDMRNEAAKAGRPERVAGLNLALSKAASIQQEQERALGRSFEDFSPKPSPKPQLPG